MNQNGLPALIVGGAVIVAALATLMVPGGWFLWLPLGLLAVVFGKATYAK